MSELQLLAHDRKLDQKYEMDAEKDHNTIPTDILTAYFHGLSY